MAHYKIIINSSVTITLIKSLVLIVLTSSTVRCDNTGNLVVDVPEESFNVYWNVPTSLCRDKNIPFEDLYKKFGIIQNSGDEFAGEKITILNHPGLLPGRVRNETTGKYININGGVPQEGDLKEHQQALISDIEKQIPDEEFNGIAVITYERWRPVFRQLFGNYAELKNDSYEIERMLHWTDREQKSDEEIMANAEKRFEESAREFMQSSLAIAKQMRPRARWGYYAYPYCYNMENNTQAECSDEVRLENDRIHWLWSESTALYPLLNGHKNMSLSNMNALIAGRLEEATRLRRRNALVLPYVKIQYSDGGLLSKDHIQVILETLHQSDAAGLIIGGVSEDVDTPDKCEKLLKYTTEVLGPAVAAFTKPSGEEHETTMANELLTTAEEVTVSPAGNDYTTSTVETSIDTNWKLPQAFSVYWNVPTFQCKDKRIPFDHLFEKFRIIQNTEDRFNGDKINLLYHPGNVPGLIYDKTTRTMIHNNGVVPQEGDLEDHQRALVSDIEKLIPDKNFNGIGIIDYERWRPVFRQLFGEYAPLKNYSYQVERMKHSNDTKPMPEKEIKSIAEKRFEEAAREFMQSSLAIAKQMRPRARWGYYAYPYCYNMGKGSMADDCSGGVKRENDRIHWLWSGSGALYPSLYFRKELTSRQLDAMIRGRVNEAARVRPAGALVLPYITFSYTNGGYLNEEHLNVMLKTLHTSKASGYIIWGSSNDVNTPDKCKSLLKYMTEILGPAILKLLSENKDATTVSNHEVTISHIEDALINNTMRSDKTSTETGLKFTTDVPASYSIYDLVTPSSDRTLTDTATLSPFNETSRTTDYSGVTTSAFSNPPKTCDAPDLIFNIPDNEKAISLKSLVSEIRLLHQETSMMRSEFASKLGDLSNEVLDCHVVKKSLEEKIKENAILHSRIVKLEELVRKHTLESLRSELVVKEFVENRENPTSAFDSKARNVGYDLVEKRARDILKSESMTSKESEST